jgi:hypothetical protein
MTRQQTLTIIANVTGAVMDTDKAEAFDRSNAFESPSPVPGQ